MSNLSLLDLMRRYYDALVSGDSSLMGALNVSPAVVGIAANNSVVAYGTVTAPVANAFIAGIGALPAGVWDVHAYLGLSGTPADLDTDNFVLSVNAVEICTIPVNKSGSVTDFNYRLKLTSTQPVGVIADVNATAGAIYTATVVASQIGF